MRRSRSPLAVNSAGFVPHDRALSCSAAAGGACAASFFSGGAGGARFFSAAPGGACAAVAHGGGYGEGRRAPPRHIREPRPAAGGPPIPLDRRGINTITTHPRLIIIKVLKHRRPAARRRRVEARDVMHVVRNVRTRRRGTGPAPRRTADRVAKPLVRRVVDPPRADAARNASTPSVVDGTVWYSVSA